MILSFHGGKCCGVKHIYGFSYTPDSPVPAQEAKTGSDADQRGNDTLSSKSFFHEKAPKETCEARFKRLVAFCKRCRPHGLIEICLSSQKCVDRYTYEYAGKMTDVWRPVVEAEGFREVASSQNSNTGNVVTILILAY